MRKKGSKQVKVSQIDRGRALAAHADEAIRKRIRTEPAYMYTSLCPDLALREAPKGVRRYYDPCRETPPGEEERKKSLHTICRGSSLRG